LGKRGADTPTHIHTTMRNSLSVPGTMCKPEALNVWHATLKELGWEK